MSVEIGTRVTRLLRATRERPKGIPDQRIAERCLRSLSGQIPSIALRFLAEDVMCFGKSGRLLAVAVTDF